MRIPGGILAERLETGHHARGDLSARGFGKIIREERKNEPA